MHHNVKILDSPSQVDPKACPGPGRVKTVKLETKHQKEIAIEKRLNIEILYGGSVNPLNTDQILSIDNVNGLLIGGASLKVKEFLAIYSSAVKKVCKIKF